VIVVWGSLVSPIESAAAVHDLTPVPAGMGMMMAVVMLRGVPHDVRMIRSGFSPVKGSADVVDCERREVLP